MEKGLTVILSSLILFYNLQYGITETLTGEPLSFTISHCYSAMKNGGEGVKDKSGKTVLNREKRWLKFIVSVRKFHFTTVKCLFKTEIIICSQRDRKQCDGTRQIMSDNRTSNAKVPNKQCQTGTQAWLVSRTSVAREPCKCRSRAVQARQNTPVSLPAGRLRGK